MQHCFVLSRKSPAISGVRDGRRNRKYRKNRCDFGALRKQPSTRLSDHWRVFRRLFVTCDVFARYFFGGFCVCVCVFFSSWPSSRLCLFFVAFLWLFRGAHLGQILRAEGPSRLRQQSTSNRPPFQSMLEVTYCMQLIPTETCKEPCSGLLDQQGVLTTKVSSHYLRCCFASPSVWNIQGQL